jgi:hypothetical protein
MAGLTDTLWSIEDLYDAVMKHQAERNTGGGSTS